jgi:hypothetical protein
MINTFEKPLSAEAYAYVHLLERYRRMWTVLRYMCKAGVLPLGVHRLRVLDIGAGPGPSLFAIEDFYGALSHYARLADVPELQIPSPRLSFIERSQSMINFFSSFREFTNRQGSIDGGFSNFTGLDLKSIREQHQRQNEIESWWDPETGAYEEIYDPVGASESASRLLRYRLVVMSNFLTLPSDVDRWSEDLGSLFRDLNPGALVVVLGGSGDKYQGIYESATQIAKDSRLREEGGVSYDIDSKAPPDYVRRVTKASQHRVYLAIEEMIGTDSLIRKREWPDYWNPEPSTKARFQFSLRIFRRGRWPSAARGAPRER